MARMIFAAALALLPLSAFAAPAVKAPTADAAFAGGLAEGLRQIKAAVPKWTSVSMNVRSDNGFIDVNEPWTRINLNGSGFNGSYNISGWADSEYISIRANPLNSQNPRNGWSIWGSRANITVRRSGDGYSIWGDVGGQHINANLNRWGGSIWGLGGGNLSVSGSNGSYWVSGQIDETRFNRASLAVLGAVIAVAGSTPEQPQVK